MKSKSKALERPQTLSVKRFYLLYSNPRQKATKTKKLRQQQMVNKQLKSVILQQNNATATINNLVNTCQKLPDDILLKVLATAISELKKLQKNKV
ncbi:hypothetical protein NIES3806_30740 [Microcystis aeruginosa NIES-3806]|uniref:hypothetical protein n=1 Tax=Microcystis aeruginosa TaxID=1126 RepID=UPI00130A8122|nr:hypothetical protein [Microcystis aeruginosa]GCL55720.1 hypothetical protein NIES3806_30740 [Microcystis aeruginosa NIES-3806]